MPVTKTWTVTSDNPRPSHAAMDGEEVPFDEPFSNGLMFPGDGSTGDAGEVANCTCVMSVEGEVTVSEEDRIAWAEENLVPQDLTYEQGAAIQSYTNHATVNEYLRGWDTSAPIREFAERNIVELDSAIAKTPLLQEDIVAYRGAMMSDFKVGQVFSDPGYTGVSLKQRVSLRYVLDENWSFLEVHMPKGANVMYTSTREAEILTQRGSKFVVESIDELATGERRVVVRMLND